MVTVKNYGKIAKPLSDILKKWPFNEIHWRNMQRVGTTNDSNVGFNQFNFPFSVKKNFLSQ